MKASGFRVFVDQVCAELESTSNNTPTRIAACKSGEDFEVCVVEAIYAVIANTGINVTVHYTPGSHAFPDIVIEFSDGARYGIEVKSSASKTSRSWKINGNSVLGTTKEDVIDTYIIFGKTAIGNQSFRYRRYEDAIANVAVTHSPRYAIDMDLAPGDTFFVKSGLTYKQITESGDPIGLITSYFKGQGQRAWWLSESTPAAIRMFSDIPEEEQLTLLGYCFAHFPEVFSSKRDKFSRCAMWLVTDHSIVSSSLRDNFSAGGRVTLNFGAHRFERIPRIFNTLFQCREYVISALLEASAEELKNDWGYNHPIGNDKILAWTSAVQLQYHPSELNASEMGWLLCHIIHNI